MREDVLIHTYKVTCQRMQAEIPKPRTQDVEQIKNLEAQVSSPKFVCT
jgi:hypothetical protein